MSAQWWLGCDAYGRAVSWREVTPAEAAEQRKTFPRTPKDLDKRLDWMTVTADTLRREVEDSRGYDPFEEW